MKPAYIFGMIAVGLFANIVVLYFLFITLQRDVTTLSSKITAPSVTPHVSVNTLNNNTSVASSQSGTCTECMAEITVLRNNIDQLARKIPSVSIQSGTQQSSSQSVKEIYIPLGTGQSSSKEFVDVPGLNSYIDTGNYPAIKEIRFEVSLRIPTANGFVYARVYNKTDDHPMWNSEVQSETDKSQLKQSSPVMLDSGNKLYQVQLKSTLGYPAFAESARLKIILQ